MSIVNAHALSEALRPVPTRHRPVRTFFTGLARAWHLARGRLTEEDARALYLQCQKQLGWYTLDLLTVDDAIDAARDVFLENPELSRLITEACATVGQRWNATENTAKARERVFEIAEALSKTQDKCISFPLYRRSPPPPDIAPNSVHALYAPQRFLRLALPGKKPTALPVPITGFDHAAARRDGWILTSLGTYRDGSPHIEIQAIKPPHFGKSIFTCDRDAWTHVVQEAKAGSALHLQALDLIDQRERMVIEASTGSW